MSARCASCSYPLTISDSVVCYECTSYFHIDCAQLVGFPYYELSSDPGRNSFHCATCKLLPLPKQQWDTDSDSDSDCAMPSRQLDYHLEAQGDFSMDMNEVRGNIQDLSDLCKDMLREINELKSVNLTLRCCVENLRHDYEERDNVIALLKQRIELLEKNGNLANLELSGSIEWDVGKLEVEREEDTERYMTPDPENARLKDLEDLVAENINYDLTLNDNKPEYLLYTDDSQSPYNLHKSEKEESISLRDEASGWEKEPEVKEKTWQDDLEDESIYRRHSEYGIGPEVYDENEDIHEESNLDVKSDEPILEKENRKDWDWKGNKAIELGYEREVEDVVDSDSESVGSVLEDEDTKGWEILDEELQTAISEHVKEEYDEDERRKWYSLKEEEELEAEMEEETEIDQEDYDIEESKLYSEKLSISHKSRLEDFPDEEPNTKDVGEDDPQFGPFPSNSQEDISRASSVLAVDKIPDEEAADKVEEGAITDTITEGEEATAEPTATEDTEQKQTEPVEGEETVETPAVMEAEHQVDSEGNVLVEAEPTKEEDQLAGEQATEEKPLSRGQSPVEGEVQLDELPQTPEPQHTAEDLWEYLRESVGSVRPATVQEFVQELIETLQSVPEEFLKPVIDANIKRATSPSVTDGEGLTTTDGLPLSEEGGAPVEGTEQGDSAPALEQGTDVPPEGDLATIPEVPSGIPEEPSTLGDPTVLQEPTALDESPSADEGYSAVEAAA